MYVRTYIKKKNYRWNKEALGKNTRSLSSMHTYGSLLCFSFTFNNNNNNLHNYPAIIITRYASERVDTERTKPRDI